MDLSRADSHVFNPFATNSLQSSSTKRPLETRMKPVAAATGRRCASDTQYKVISTHMRQRSIAGQPSPQQGPDHGAGVHPVSGTPPQGADTPYNVDEIPGSPLPQKKGGERLSLGCFPGHEQLF